MSSNENFVTPFSAAVPVNATVTAVDGASAGGNASSSKPTISGLGEPGSVVNLYDGVRWLGSAVVAANGAWSITAATALKAGSHAFTVIGVGADGVNTLSSDPFRVTVPADTSTVPPTPAIGSIIDHAGPVTGPIAPGGFTDDTKPTITGSGAKPGDIVTVSDNGVPIGSATVTPAGEWSVTPTNPLGNGPHTITATEKNPSTGGTSTPSPAVTINVDATVPSTPSVHITDPNTGANVPSGGTSGSPNPVISGSGAKPGDIITVSDNGTPIASTTVKPDGTWSVTPSPALGNGSHNITATETNPATGAISTPSTVLPIIVDSSVPATPVIGTVTDHVGPVTGPIASGDTTDDPRPTIAGSGAKPGDIVTVSDNGTPIGSATVDASGNWSLTPANPLGNGSHPITATEKNPVTGATSNPSPAIIVNVDTSPVTTPAVTGVLDHTGSVTGNIAPNGSTDELRPVVSGTGHAGDLIVVKDGSTVLGSTTVAGDGTWSFVPASDLATGTHHITATASNQAGALSTPSADYAFTISTTPAATPAITGLTDAIGSVQGNVAAGGRTDDHAPTIQGTGHAGDTITIKDGNNILGAATVAANGTWSFRPSFSLADGAHDLTATATNALGISGAPSSHYPFTIGSDPIVPHITYLVGQQDGQIIYRGQTTSDTSFVIYGTGAPGETVGIAVKMRPTTSNVVIGAVVDANGNWSANLPAYLVQWSDEGYGIRLALGAISMSSGLYDGPFNAYSSSSHPTQAEQPSIDSLFDDVGAITGNILQGATTDDARPAAKGTGHPGDIIKISDNGTLIGSTAVDGAGNWSFTPPAALGNGWHSLTAVASANGLSDSKPSGAYGFTVAPDTVTPTAQTPSITGLYDDVGAKQGNVASGGQTDDTRPTISGKGHAGDVVTVKDGSTVLGSTQVDGTGNWSFTPANALANGGHDLTAVASGNGQNASGTSGHYTFTVAADAPVANLSFSCGAPWHTVPNGGHVWTGTTYDDPTHGTFSVSGLSSSTNVRLYCDGVLLGSTNTVTIGGVALFSEYVLSGPDALHDGWRSLGAGRHDFTVSLNNGPQSAPFTIYFDGGSPQTYQIDQQVSVEDTAILAALHDGNVTQSPEVKDAPDAGNDKSLSDTTAHTVSINADPNAYFQQSGTHVQGNHSGLDTVALTGNHQVLDLSALTGKTAAAKISGIEVFDLGGHQNTLKVSLIDVLNLGQKDLFVQNGEQQVMVKGQAGDSVDLSNTHIAGVADGTWQQHGTAVVGGVTFNVFEHSGAHVELLVQQGVATTVHQ